jgi:myosin heavy subunit
VSGESGAGKTETVKILMSHCAYIAGKQGNNTVEKLLKANPLLGSFCYAFVCDSIYYYCCAESFGNAKTVRNDNSSRFGKYTQLQFDGNNILVGSKCVTYLLEKTRVVVQNCAVGRGNKSPTNRAATSERNYHIFYQLLAAPTVLKQKLSLAKYTARDFNYTRAGQAADNDDFNKLLNCDAVTGDVVEGVTDGDRLLATIDALQLLGLKESIRLQLYQMLIGILFLGNIGFVGVDGDNTKAIVDQADSGSRSDDASALDICSKLLAVSVEDLKNCLCWRTIDVENAKLPVPLSVEQAVAGRDAMAKEIYSRVFNWLVHVINFNTSFRPTGHGTSTSNGAVTTGVGTISLLDIFGFECFPVNSFEQLCINYANEKLHQKFTFDVLASVQQEYGSEGLTFTPLTFQDNSEVLAMIEDKKGIFQFLNEESLIPRGSDTSFLNKLKNSNNSGSTVNSTFFTNPLLQQQQQFVITHYAGKVTYTVTGFLERNKDSVPEDMNSLLSASRNVILSRIFTLTQYFDNRVSEDVDLVGSLPSNVCAELLLFDVNGNGVVSSPNRGATKNGISYFYGTNTGAALQHSRSAGDVGVLTLEDRVGGVVNGSRSQKEGSGRNNNANNPLARRSSFLLQDTVTTKFRSQLNKLVQTLSQTHTHYIKCLNPNEHKSPNEFNRALIVEQLRCEGLVSVVSISREQYPNRMRYAQFVNVFRCLQDSSWLKEQVYKHLQVASALSGANIDATAAALMNDRNKYIVTAMLRTVVTELDAERAGTTADTSCDTSSNSSADDDIRGSKYAQYFQFGHTKLYFSAQVMNYLEHKRVHALHRCATRLQAFARTRRQRLAFAAIVRTIVYIQSVLRMISARKHRRTSLRAVIRMQCLVRRLRARALRRRLRDLRAAVTLQTWVRGTVIAHRRFVATCRSISKLQSVLRMCLARKQYIVLRNERRAVVGLHERIRSLEQALVSEQLQTQILQQLHTDTQTELVLRHEQEVDQHARTQELLQDTLAKVAALESVIDGQHKELATKQQTVTEHTTALQESFARAQYLQQCVEERDAEIESLRSDVKSKENELANQNQMFLAIQVLSDSKLRDRDDAVAEHALINSHLRDECDNLQAVVQSLTQQLSEANKQIQVAQRNEKDAAVSLLEYSKQSTEREHGLSNQVKVLTLELERLKRQHHHDVSLGHTGAATRRPSLTLPHTDLPAHESHARIPHQTPQQPLEPRSLATGPDHHFALDEIGIDGLSEAGEEEDEVGTSLRRISGDKNSPSVDLLFDAFDDDRQYGEEDEDIDEEENEMLADLEHELHVHKHAIHILTNTNSELLQQLQQTHTEQTVTLEALTQARQQIQLLQNGLEEQAFELHKVTQVLAATQLELQEANAIQTDAQARSHKHIEKQTRTISLLESRCEELNNSNCKLRFSVQHSDSVIAFTKAENDLLTKQVEELRQQLQRTRNQAGGGAIPNWQPSATAPLSTIPAADKVVLVAQQAVPTEPNDPSPDPVDEDTGHAEVMCVSNRIPFSWRSSVQAEELSPRSSQKHVHLVIEDDDDTSQESDDAQDNHASQDNNARDDKNDTIDTEPSGTDEKVESLQDQCANSQEDGTSAPGVNTESVNQYAPAEDMIAVATADEGSSDYVDVPADEQPDEQPSHSKQEETEKLKEESQDEGIVAIEDDSAAASAPVSTEPEVEAEPEIPEEQIVLSADMQDGVENGIAMVVDGGSHEICSSAPVMNSFDEVATAADQVQMYATESAFTVVMEDLIIDDVRLMDDDSQDKNAADEAESKDEEPVLVATDKAADVSSDNDEDNDLSNFVEQFNSPGKQRSLSTDLEAAAPPEMSLAQQVGDVATTKPITPTSQKKVNFFPDEELVSAVTIIDRRTETLDNAAGASVPAASSVMSKLFNQDGSNDVVEDGNLAERGEVVAESTSTVPAAVSVAINRNASKSPRGTITSSLRASIGGSKVAGRASTRLSVSIPATSPRNNPGSLGADNAAMGAGGPRPASPVALVPSLASTKAIRLSRVREQEILNLINVDGQDPPLSAQRRQSTKLVDPFTLYDKRVFNALIASQSSSRYRGGPGVKAKIFLSSKTGGIVDKQITLLLKRDTGSNSSESGMVEPVNLEENVVYYEDLNLFDCELQSTTVSTPTSRQAPQIIKQRFKFTADEIKFVKPGKGKTIANALKTTEDWLCCHLLLESKGELNLALNSEEERDTMVKIFKMQWKQFYGQRVVNFDGIGSSSSRDEVSLM